MVYYKPRIPVSYVIKKSWPLLIPMMGWHFGSYLDDLYGARCVRFRDRSALYGRKLAEGEPPSWE